MDEGRHILVFLKAPHKDVLITPTRMIAAGMSRSDHFNKTWNEQDKLLSRDDDAGAANHNGKADQRNRQPEP